MSPARRPYYSSTYVRMLFDYLAARGVDAPALLGESRPPENDRGLTLYSGARWRRMLQRAAEALHDPLLGLRVGQQITPAHLGVLGYALHACANLGAALARWQQYESLVTYVARMEVHLQPASVTLEWVDAPELQGALVDETALAALVQFVRNLTGRRETPELVCFVNAAPRDLQPYRDFFGCEVRFEQPLTRLRLPTSMLAHPLRQPDENLLRLLEQQADALLRELPSTDDLEQAVRQAVARLARSGEVSQEQIAAQMHMSTRTLHRRLESRGLNFRALRDDTRLHLAQDHLADPRLTLGEVAWLLGYSEHSAFTRAFRRWTGEAPQQWRSRHQVAQPAPRMRE